MNKTLAISWAMFKVLETLQTYTLRNEQCYITPLGYLSTDSAVQFQTRTVRALQKRGLIDKQGRLSLPAHTRQSALYPMFVIQHSKPKQHKIKHSQHYTEFEKL